MNARITVPLDASESFVLIDIVRSDCRHSQEQPRFILRGEARRRGLLNDDLPKVRLSGDHHE